MKTLVLILVLSFSILGQTYRYVDPEASGANNGLSWENAWNGFDDFNINDHSSVPPGTTILVAAGTYSTGHISYGDAIIRIDNNNNITIKPGDPRFEEGDPLVVLSGSSSMEYGIVAQPANCLITVNVHHISILGIKFENFTRNPIKLSGYRRTLPDDNTCTNFLEDVDVRFCHFSDIAQGTGNFRCGEISCAAIHVQSTKNAKIENCTIIHDTDIEAQTDGIYVDYSDNVEIRDNYIKIKNDETPPLWPLCPPENDDYYHIDCIQFADQPYGHCENITVERNQLIQNGDDDRYSGIIMSGIEGVIKIYNNNIVATKSQSLLNLRFYDYTQSLWIFNNTLVGLEGNTKLVGINEISGDITQILRIRNNIFYKQGGSNQGGLTFVLPTGSLSNEVLDYNLYRNSNGTIMLTEINNESNPWNWGPWEVNGTDVDPNFQINNGLYGLNLNSDAKNLGQVLQNYGLTSDYFQIKRPYWVNGVDLGAFEIPEAQVRIGLASTGSPITHTIEAVGTYWNKEENVASWPISTDPALASSAFTSSYISSNKEEWNGFHLKWMRNNVNEKPMGHAFYKLTNNHSDAFIYIDLRDAVTNYNPNIYIRYDQSLNPHLYSYWNINTEQFEPIDNGTVLRVWQINNGEPNTLSLSSYWFNALLRVDDGNNPLLIWGPYPDPGNINGSLSEYKLYRSGTHVPGIPPANYSVLYSADLDEYSYTDETAFIGNDNNAYSYRTTAIFIDNSESSFETDPTNRVEVRLIRQSKFAQINIYPSEYNLAQNYPNPFNPLTTICFSLPEDNKVELKIYNILGKEIKVLLNEDLAAGFYDIEFNAANLASGIYFYKLSAGKYSETKKLQLIK